MATATKTGRKPATAAAKVRKPAAKTTGTPATEQYTSWSEIKKKYPYHWIVVANPVFEKDDFTLKKGILLCASENRDDLKEIISKSPKKHFCIERVGSREKRLFLL